MSAESQNLGARWLILIGLMMAAVMEVLDTTIVNVALPTMAGNLGATFEEVAWVSTGYILSNVIVLPITAYLTSVFGRRNYLSASIVIFIVASFLCGTSHSLIELVIWRIVQGAGGAALLSTAQATIRQIFPQNQQAMVQTVFLLGIIVAPTIGPTIGGWITDNYSWNWCFFINVPIGICAAFLVTNFLKDPKEAKGPKPKADFLGIGLLAVGLGALQYILEEGNQDDWFSSLLITRLAILSGASLLAMIWWEISPRNKMPVIDFRVLKNRDLSLSIFLFIALGFGLYGGTYIFPLFSQSILNFTPTETGLALLPGGLATAGAAMICGTIMSKGLVDARYLIGFGVGVFLFSMWTLGHLSSTASYDSVRLPLILRGFAIGFLFAPVNSAAFGTIDPRQAQQASGLLNLGRQLGGSFGIAILGTYLTTQSNVHRANLVHYVYQGGYNTDSRLTALTHVMMGHGASFQTAQKMAVGMLDNLVNVQASMQSYNDCWIMILLSFAMTAPAILFLRKSKGGSVPVDAH
jgi:DHA2 family multidrug resistance protein